MGLRQITKKKNNFIESGYEPPKKSATVNLLMNLTSKYRHIDETPHLFGGEDISKVEYEYKAATNTPLTNTANIKIEELFKDKEVLDAGCGWGGKTIYYAEKFGVKKITGFDLPGYRPEVSDNYSKKRGLDNCFFDVGYAEKMPFKNNSFDSIIMEDVFEHVADPEKVLNECYRVARSGGQVIIKFPSTKMMLAHHLDRAINLPSLHWLMSLKKWAAGLNYLLVTYPDKFNYQQLIKSFPRVIIAQ